MTATRDRQSDNDEMEIVEKPAAQGARGRRMAAQVAEEDMSEGEGIARSGEESGADEVEEIIVPPTTKLRPGSKKSAPRTGKPLLNTANGATKTGTNALVKGKGKQRAILAPKKSSRQEVEPMDTNAVGVPADDMDVDDAELDVVDEPVVVVAPSNRQLNAKSNKPGKVQAPPPQDQKKDAYIAQLEKQLQQVQSNCPVFVKISDCLFVSGRG